MRNDWKDDKKRWDEIYKTEELHQGINANQFLKDSIHLVRGGRALDIASGYGRNAIFLAQKGFQVEAVDISQEGLKRAKKLAEEKGVQINFFLADLNGFHIPKETYDLIINFYYLEREIIPHLKEGLKKGGTIIFETYTVDQRSIGRPFNPDYLLRTNELLNLFRDLKILFYREGVFEENEKKKAIASLVAQKDQNNLT